MLLQSTSKVAGLNLSMKRGAGVSETRKSAAELWRTTKLTYTKLIQEKKRTYSERGALAQNMYVVSVKLTSKTFATIVKDALIDGDRLYQSAHRPSKEPVVSAKGAKEQAVSYLESRVDEAADEYETIERFDDSFGVGSLKAYLAEFISTLLFVFAGVGSITVLTGIFYWVAQLVGAIAGAFLIKFVTGLDTPTHGLSAGLGAAEGIVMEIIITFALVYTVYATAVDPKKGSLGTIAPIAIGLIVGVLEVSRQALM
ncbi:uncharacterized protein A4U43_C06F16940 [Asparagus officinalis]|uniref:Uncharacterized protein n=1 Tax=Asparagus officinalis TaxID=4686 RepID=A0A5P1EME8_ASPOF|nr:uncharacterized protein A4U43_C06F16940 [Asparagus officinalis]